jgi:hypothetical protein
MSIKKISIKFYHLAYVVTCIFIHILWTWNNLTNSKNNDKIVFLTKYKEELLILGKEDKALIFCHNDHCGNNCLIFYHNLLSLTIFLMHKWGRAPPPLLKEWLAPGKRPSYKFTAVLWNALFLFFKIWNWIKLHEEKKDSLSAVLLKPNLSYHLLFKFELCTLAYLYISSLKSPVLNCYWFKWIVRHWEIKAHITEQLLFNNQLYNTPWIKWQEVFRYFLTQIKGRLVYGNFNRSESTASYFAVLRMWHWCRGNVSMESLFYYVKELTLSIRIFYHL